MIEAIVALALVSGMLAAIGSLVATTARGARKLEQHVALVETLRLIATSLPRFRDPQRDDLRGESSGHRWQVRLSPFLGGPVVPGASWAPQRVELRVRSPSGATISLETIRLQRTSEQQ